MITFLLLVIGLILVITNYKAIRKENSSFKKNMNEATDNLKDYNLEIGTLRKDFAETIFELQKDIENLKGNEKEAKEEEIVDEYISDDYMLQEDNEALEEIDIKKNSAKVNEIKQMLDEGLSIDSISEKLGIGKGEILLIEKLYLK